MHESCPECGNYPCSCRDPRLTTWCPVCGAWTTRDLRTSPSESVCSNGHVTVWGYCGGKRLHDPHEWGADAQRRHCHGQGFQSSTFILYGRDEVSV